MLKGDDQGCLESGVKSVSLKLKPTAGNILSLFAVIDYSSSFALVDYRMEQLAYACIWAAHHNILFVCHIFSLILSCLFEQTTWIKQRCSDFPARIHPCCVNDRNSLVSEITLQVRFKLDKEWERDQVFKQMGGLWRASKSRLVSDVKNAANEEERLQLQPDNIKSVHDWKDFVKEKTSQEFKEHYAHCLPPLINNVCV
ncbi:hypothetical protein RHGRI_006494 [Rhododendron griersonianum]|uniref:Uncharacterized protein n=1 Tax=Rhododendron griersonianum TaxID=479676 RepID=A0AAV6KUX7_9ERIC|nr:hypothetical protein RHGRI_006494 [Rhododendron griersonianum]